jgi:hypothetical protein
MLELLLIAFADFSGRSLLPGDFLVERQTTNYM